MLKRGLIKKESEIKGKRKKFFYFDIYSLVINNKGEKLHLKF